MAYNWNYFLQRIRLYLCDILTIDKEFTFWGSYFHLKNIEKKLTGITKITFYTIQISSFNSYPRRSHFALLIYSTVLLRNFWYIILINIMITTHFNISLFINKILRILFFIRLLKLFYRLLILLLFHWGRDHVVGCPGFLFHLFFNIGHSFNILLFFIILIRNLFISS